MRAEVGLTSAQSRKITSEVKRKYRLVAGSAEQRFPYPVGRASARRLGYAARWLTAIPKEVVDRFVGVGNPFRLLTPAPGERVLDVGCGCGFDSFVASLLVGERGRVVGFDLTGEMLAVARKAKTSWPLANLDFRAGSVEKLPFEDRSFDVVISNGVLNLVLDKDAALGEIARVLRPGGTLAAADLLLKKTVPEEVVARMDAWSD